MIEALGLTSLASIQRLTRSVDRFAWVTGQPDHIPAAMGGEVRQDLALQGPTSGTRPRRCLSPRNLRPLAPQGQHRLGAKRVITRACFIHDERRLILPAFGTFTGGLNVRHPSIMSLFEAEFALRDWSYQLRTIPVGGANRIGTGARSPGLSGLHDPNSHRSAVTRDENPTPSSQPGAASTDSTADPRPSLVWFRHDLRLR